jgi:hypothetical protein
VTDGLEAHPDLEERPFTVNGFWHETWERFTWHVMAPGAVYAEELFHLEGQNRGGHLGCTGVFEGHLMEVSPHYWVDPSVTSQEQMDAVREDAEYE